ncbi:hypothetical protein DL769_005813 [Monosporascus sp. CRB-8-3]|nr:hypothetical protein DL769_005813 [Monosporascus sp. CRB-8-3]
MPDSTMTGGSHEPLAIIGMACRYGGAIVNTSELLRHIMNGKSVYGPVPAGRVDAEFFYHPDTMHAGSIYTKGGYFLQDDIIMFDSAFFQLSDKDTAAMDPQQNMLLENVYHALENDPLVFSQNKVMGTSPAILANRISWFYDLRGTSQTIDTACSSSLVAFHQACRNVQSGDSPMAIVSGVNLMEHPSTTQNLCNLGVLSPDGQCFTFDERANGYGRGEGVGTVVIKPLRHALRDCNPIHAVVRGTGSNQDGRTAGITLPSKDAQQCLIRQIYASQKLDMAETCYVEAHGTATQVGDPLEISAISAAFGDEGRADLHISSVKSVIGHLEGGAGVAGLISATLAIRSSSIPPVANLQNVNPAIQGGKYIKFLKVSRPWPKVGVRRASVNSFGLGGTNAHVVLEDVQGFLHRWMEQPPTLELGFPLSPFRSTCVGNAGMTNGSTHGVHPPQHIRPNTKRILVLSAYDEEGVSRTIARLAEYAEASLQEDESHRGEDYMADLLYTLNERRTTFDWRTFCLVDDSLGSLPAAVRQAQRPTRVSAAPKSLRFVFTGQGANWPGMALDLMKYPLFEERIAQAGKFFMSLGSEWNLRACRDADTNDPVFAQSACVAVQVALVDLLLSWNIIPAMVVGHSSGELAAAYCAGKISRQYCWRAAFFRGHVCRKMSGEGAMLAAAMAESDAKTLICRLEREGTLDVSIGCYNSPKNVTFTGNKDGILRLKDTLERSGIFNRQLQVKVAYHSHDLKQVADDYLASLRDQDSGDKINQGAGIRMQSSVTGRCIDSTDVINPAYWVENLVSPVRFSSALLASFQLPQKASRKRDSSTEVIVEIGPHSALQSAIKDILSPHSDLQSVIYHSLLKRGETKGETILNTVGSLHSLGYDVNLAGVNAGRGPYDTPDVRHILPDLPPYPFSCTSRQARSRQIEAISFPPYKRHELLGIPATDANPFELRWRNVIRLQDIPWLSSNDLNGNILFPGVAYIAMAVEATLLASRTDASVAGVQLRDISIRESLFVPDTTQGVETIFSLSQHRNDVESIQWSRFRFLSHNRDSNIWTEHCDGWVRVEENQFTSGEQLLSAELEATKSSNSAQERYFSRPVAPLEFYEKFAAAGMEFGSDFKNIRGFRLSANGKSCVSLVAPPAIPKMAHDRYAIHPCALESILHGLLCLCSSGERIVDNPMVANHIGRIWVTNPLDAPLPKFYKSFAEIERKTSTVYAANVEIYKGETATVPAISIEQLELVLLPTPGSDKVPEELFYFETWKPDVRLARSAEQMHVDLNPQRDLIKPLTEEDLACFQLASAVFILDVVDRLDDFDLTSLPPYLLSFVDWMRAQSDTISEGRARFLDLAALARIRADVNLKQGLFADVSKRNARGELLVLIGTRIGAVLRGEVDSLEIMFGNRNDIMVRTYNEGLPGGVATQLREYLHCLTHNQTGLRILEAGGGTGSATNVILNALKSSQVQGAEDSPSPVATYDFTDISPAFFENARERFAEWSDILRYMPFDIEKDPGLQAMELGTYDLVVATHCVHATADLQVSLRNLRSLLKSGGDLVLIENVQPDLMCSPLTFGVLPGWWRSIEPARRCNPLILEHEWESELLQAGFTPRLRLHDSAVTASHEISAIIARASDKDELVSNRRPQCTIVYDEKTEYQRALAHELSKIPDFESSLIPICNVTVDQLQESICLALFNFRGFYLSDVTNACFEKVKLLLMNSTAILWLSEDSTEDARAAMSRGLVRTARWERDQDGVNFITLDIANPWPDAACLASKITYITRNAFILRNIVPRNAELALKGGRFLTNRLYPATGANKAINEGHGPKSTLTRLGDVVQPMRLTVVDPYAPQSLQLVVDELATRPLGLNEVVIKVHASGLTPAEVEDITRLIPGETLGRSCAGLVSAVGGLVTDLAVGDRVMALRTTRSAGALQTHFRTHFRAVQRIPEEINLPDAATVPWSFCSAYHALMTVAQTKQGDSIILQYGNNAISQAAVQLALRTQIKLWVLVAGGELSDSSIWQSSIDPSWVIGGSQIPLARTKILEGTGGRGVDIYLNCDDAGLSNMRQLPLSYGARVVDLFSTSTTRGGCDLDPALPSNVYYTRINMNTVAESQVEAIGNAFADVSRWLAARQLQPLHGYEIMRFSEVPKALMQCRDQSLERPTIFIFCAEDNDIVPVQIRPIGDYRLRDDVSYLLVGGFGGIGRRLALWMQSRGAKNFLFLSRSGRTVGPADTVCAELESLGCAVTSIACDVTDSKAVKLALETCKTTMPPIKGCIQCSMVLQDSMISNMSHGQFVAATAPKVAGTRNVAENLPLDLDFFILLSSSAATIGNRGQANYAAGNAFLDAYAKQLTSTGRPTTSISLGSVLSVGWVAENQERLPIALSYGTIAEDRFLSVVEFHMDPRWGAAVCTETCHTIAGLRSAADFERAAVPLPNFMAYPLFAHLRAAERQAKAKEAETSVDVAQALRSAASVEEVGCIIADAIIAKISHVMAMPPKNLESCRTPASYGVDSLVTVDMKTWFKKELHATVTTQDISGELTIDDLARKVAADNALVAAVQL